MPSATERGLLLSLFTANRSEGAGMAVKVQVVFSKGPLAGRGFAIKCAGKYTVGSGTGSHIRIANDSSLAAQHFRLIVTEDAVRIAELPGAAPITINGETIDDMLDLEEEPIVEDGVETVTLASRDRIQAGNSEFVVRIIKPGQCVRCGELIAGYASSGSAADDLALCPKCLEKKRATADLSPAPAKPSAATSAPPPQRPKTAAPPVSAPTPQRPAAVPVSSVSPPRPQPAVKPGAPPPAASPPPAGARIEQPQASAPVSAATPVVAPSPGNVENHQVKRVSVSVPFSGMKEEQQPQTGVWRRICAMVTSLFGRKPPAQVSHRPTALTEPAAPRPAAEESPGRVDKVGTGGEAPRVFSPDDTLTSDSDGSVTSAEAAQTAEERAGTTVCLDCGRDRRDELGEERPRYFVCHSCSRLINLDLAGFLIRIDVPVPQRSEGTLRNEFEFKRKIGEGMLTRVYQAYDRARKRDVAIKVIVHSRELDDAMRKRLMRQLKTLRMLQNTNIVQMLGYGISGDAMYFVMEYCNEGNIEDLMKARGGTLELDEARKIMAGALKGLALAHRHKIVHRDIKPQNILLARDDSGRISVKIADFGLAKQFQGEDISNVTMMGTRIGAPKFMPREQALDFKNVRPSADVWSVAATFYYMLTGEPPRPAPVDGDAIGMVLEGKAIKIRQRSHEIPRKLAKVIDRALSVEPEKRYQNADEFLEALANAI